MSQTRSTSRQGGVALLLVLFAVATAVIISLSFAASQATSTGIAHNARNHSTARVIAESGLKMAIEHVKDDNNDWRNNFSNGTWVNNLAFANGTFTITGEDGEDTDGDGVVDGDGDLADDTTDKLTLTAIGTFDGVKHRVRAVVTPAVASESYSPMFAAEEKVEVKGTAVIEVSAASYSVSTNSTSSGDINVADNAVIDCDVYVGVGGSTSTVILLGGSGQITGSTDVLTESVDITAPSEPSLGSSVGDVTYSSGTTTISSDLHCDRLTIVNNAIVEIDGEVTILASDTDIAFEIDDTAQLKLLPGATLNLYTKGKFLANGNSRVNVNTADPSRFYAYHLSSSKHWDLKEQTIVYATVIAPYNLFHANGDTHFYGSYQGLEAKVENQAQVHVGNGGESTLNDGLIGHWKLDETSGTSAGDSSGSGHSGTVADGTWTTGQDGGAMDFDGSDDYISVASTATLQLTTALSVSAWIKGDSWSSDSSVDTILRKGEDNPNNYQFAIADGRPTLYLDDSDTSGYRGDTTLSTGTWYHVAATWDGTTAKVYVDGVLDNGSGDSHTSTLGTDSRAVYIGGRSGTDLHNGILDDVRLYDRALTDAEVAQLAAGTTGEEEEGDSPNQVVLYEFNEVARPTPQLIGHWKLDEAAGGGTGGPGIAVASDVELDGNNVIDSYDSSAGPYGGANIGSAATVSTNSTSSDKIWVSSGSTIQGNAYCGAGGNPSNVIDDDGTITGTQTALASNVDIPDNDAPTGMPSSLGDETYSSNQTWSSDLKFDDLTIQNSCIVTVSGNIRVEVTGELNIKNDASVVIGEGSSMILYVGSGEDDITIEDNAVVNTDTSAPDRLTLISYDSEPNLVLKNEAQLAAVLQLEDDLEMSNNSQFFGTVVSNDDIEIEDSAKIHMDVRLAGGSTTAVDQTGTSDGTYRNGPTGNESGQIDTAVLFDGTDDYIEIPHNDAYKLDQGSVTLWFKALDASSRGELFSRDSAGFDSGGHLTAYVQSSKVYATLQSTGQSYTVEGGSIVAGNWYHVTVTWGLDGLTLFIGGSEVDRDSYTGGLKDNSEPIVLGASSVNSGDASATPLQDYFDGWLDDVRLYDQQLDAGQISNVMADSAPGASSLPGYVVADTSGNGTPLNLTVQDTSNITWIDGGGLTFDTATKAVSSDAATKIYDALTATDAMTIEVKFTPANITQNGPANIVSYSTSTSSRNFTVAQDAERYLARLRTTDTTSNGTPDVESGDVLTTDDAHHVIITYDGEYVKMYRNGSSSAEVSTERTGTFNWDNAYKLMLGNEDSDDRPWLGTIHRVAIWDQSIAGGQVTNVFGGSDPGPPIESTQAFAVVWKEMQ